MPTTDPLGHRLAPVAALLAAGCVATTAVDLARYERDDGFRLSADPVPEAHRPLAALAHDRTGFYLLGVLPVVRVELIDGVNAIVERARRLGATGIANLRYEYRPASSLRFVVFPIPDWSASLSITATAYAPTEASSPPPGRTPTAAGDPAAAPR